MTVGIQEQHTHCTQQSPTICTHLGPSSPRTESSWEYPPSTVHPRVDSRSVEGNERREVKWNPKCCLDPIAVPSSRSHLRPYRDEPSASRPIRADKHRRGQRVLTWVTSREHCAAAGFFLLLDPLRPQNDIFAIPYHSWSLPDAPCWASQSLERMNVPHRTTESSTKGYSNYILDPCSFNYHAVPDSFLPDIHEYSEERQNEFQGDRASFYDPLTVSELGTTTLWCLFWKQLVCPVSCRYTRFLRTTYYCIVYLTTVQGRAWTEHFFVPSNCFSGSRVFFPGVLEINKLVYVHLCRAIPNSCKLGTVE